MPHCPGLLQFRRPPPCGSFAGGITPFPVRRTFNRFIRRLADHADLVADALAGVAEGLKDRLPDLGQPGAVAATALWTPSNPNRREVSDPEASWGVKHSVKSKNKDATEGFFGYKRPGVADANYGIPLAQFVTTGRRNDCPELPALIERAKARHSWFQPAVAIADRGYDAASNHPYLHRQGITPVIHIRRPSNKTGLYQDIYTQGRRSPLPGDGGGGAGESLRPAFGDKPLLGGSVIREQPEQFGQTKALAVVFARSRLVSHCSASLQIS